MPGRERQILTEASNVYLFLSFNDERLSKSMWDKTQKTENVSSFPSTNSPLGGHLWFFLSPATETVLLESIMAIEPGPMHHHTLRTRTGVLLLIWNHSINKQMRWRIYTHNILISSFELWLCFSIWIFFPTDDRSLNMPIKYIWRDFQREISKHFININSLILLLPWQMGGCHILLSHYHWEKLRPGLNASLQACGRERHQQRPRPAFVQLAHSTCWGRGKQWKVRGIYCAPDTGSHQSVLTLVHQNPVVERIRLEWLTPSETKVGFSPRCVRMQPDSSVSSWGAEHVGANSVLQKEVTFTVMCFASRISTWGGIPDVKWAGGVVTRLWFLAT